MKATMKMDVSRVPKNINISTDPFICYRRALLPGYIKRLI